MQVIRLATVTLLIVCAFAQSASAQWVVTDPTLTARNAFIAALKQELLETLANERDRLWQMARRLTLFASLDRYVAPEVPRWRTHDDESDAVQYSSGYQRALNFGDAAGGEYARVARSRVAPPADLLDSLPATGRNLALSALATIDAADSAMIAGTDQTGAIRFNGRREIAAADALQRMVIDPSVEQSATAILEKISGAVLLEVRQKQARLQLLGALAEQLVLENKRLRDTEVAALNMQAGRLRKAQTENSRFIAGTADDLRAWRQP